MKINPFLGILFLLGLFTCQVEDLERGALPNIQVEAELFQLNQLLLRGEARNLSAFFPKENQFFKIQYLSGEMMELTGIVESEDENEVVFTATLSDLPLDSMLQIQACLLLVNPNSGEARIECSDWITPATGQLTLELEGKVEEEQPSQQLELSGQIGGLMDGAEVSEYGVIWLDTSFRLTPLPELLLGMPNLNMEIENGSTSVDVNFVNFYTLECGVFRYARAFAIFDQDTVYSELQEFLLGDCWIEITNFQGIPPPRLVQAVGFSIGDKGYIATGRTEFGQLSDFSWAYDPFLNEWTDLGAMSNQGGRQEAISFVLNGKGYVGLGNESLSAVQPKQDFYQLDTSSHTWIPVPNDFPEALTAATSFVIDDIAYVGAGKQCEPGADNCVRKDFWKYDATGMWTQIAAVDQAYFGRQSAVGFGIDGKGYVVSGKEITAKPDTIWIYTPDDNQGTWEVQAGGDYAFGAGRFSAVGAVINNRGYMATGTGDFISLPREMKIFNPNSSTPKWLEGKRLPEGQGLTGATGFALKGKMYLYGGENTSGFSGSLWVYTPSLGLWE